MRRPKEILSHHKDLCAAAHVSTRNSLQRHTLLEADVRLPLDPLVTRIGSLFSVDPARSSPLIVIVVRRIEPFRTGCVRGLSTDVFQFSSRSLFTMRRAALAEIIFSFGGELADAGLRRR